MVLCADDHKDLHSFPTRRSSDLYGDPTHRFTERPAARRGKRFEEPRAFPARSEEHTSELQSPDQLVLRLLLEKKKTIAVFAFAIVFIIEASFFSCVCSQSGMVTT